MDILQYKDTNSWFKINSKNGIFFLEDKGTSNNYKVDLTNNLELYEGLLVLLNPKNTNTGYSTFSIDNGITEYPIVKVNNNVLEANEINKHQLIIMVFSNNSWVLLNDKPAINENVEANVLISNTDAANAPLQVLSQVMVDNLNVEMLGGKTISDIYADIPDMTTYSITSGTSSAYTLTRSEGVVESNELVIITPHINSEINPTLNINSGGAINLKGSSGNNIVKDELKVGYVYGFRYDGSNYKLEYSNDISVYEKASVSKSGIMSVNDKNKVNALLINSNNHSEYGASVHAGGGTVGIGVWSMTDYSYALEPRDIWITNSNGGLSESKSQVGGAGTQNAGLCFGGFVAARVRTTEKFNGSTWSTSGNLSAIKNQVGGAGTQSAGLCFGGYSTSNINTTEKFNGSTWSTSGNLSESKRELSGAGTQSAGLCFGGFVTSTINTTEKFNGSTWSTSGALSESKTRGGGAGTQNAGLCFGGNISSMVNTTEKFNGSTWSTSGGLSESKEGVGGAGTQDAGLCFGGYTGVRTNTTEKFNGSTWSTSGNLSVSISEMGGAGTQNAGLCFGGNISSRVNTTEKFIGNDYEAFESVTHASGITEDIWSLNDYSEYNVLNGVWISEASGNLSESKYLLGGAGTQNAGLCFGGNIGSSVNTTEKFNGSTWSTSGNLSVSKSAMGGAGTQNAGLCFGGRNTSNVNVNTTEKFNGSTWSTSGNLSESKYLLGGAGAQNAGLCFGGTIGSSVNTTEKFNGSTWSTSGNLSVSKYGVGGAGTQNAGLCFGGTPTTNVTEKFNGSTWSASGNLSVSKYNVGGAGTQNAGLCFGGYTGAFITNVTEKFNGSTWSTSGNLSEIKYQGGGAGTQNAGLCVGGRDASHLGVNATEKFIGNEFPRHLTPETLTVSSSNIITPTNHTHKLQLHDYGVVSKYRTNKDSEGIFTTITYKRADATIYATSVLSGGTTPEYTTRTETFYDEDGTTVLSTNIYTLTYDVDGALVDEELT